MFKTKLNQIERWFKGTIIPSGKVPSNPPHKFIDLVMFKGHGVTLVVTEDVPNFRNWLATWIPADTLATMGVTGEGFSTYLGCCMHPNRHNPIVWLPRKPVTRNQMATLSHEMFHATCRIMATVRVQFDTKSEETFAYCLSYLVSSALDWFDSDTFTQDVAIYNTNSEPSLSSTQNA